MAEKAKTCGILRGPRMQSGPQDVPHMGDLDSKLAFEQEEKLGLAMMKVFADPAAVEVLPCDQGSILEGKQGALGGCGKYLEGIPHSVLCISAGCVLFVANRLEAG